MESIEDTDPPVIRVSVDSLLTHELNDKSRQTSSTNENHNLKWLEDIEVNKRGNGTETAMNKVYEQRSSLEHCLSLHDQLDHGKVKIDACTKLLGDVSTIDKPVFLEWINAIDSSILSSVHLRDLINDQRSKVSEQFIAQSNGWKWIVATLSLVLNFSSQLEASFENISEKLSNELLPQTKNVVRMQEAVRRKKKKFLNNTTEFQRFVTSIVRKCRVMIMNEPEFNTFLQSKNEEFVCSGGLLDEIITQKSDVYSGNEISCDLKEKVKTWFDQKKEDKRAVDTVITALENIKELNDIKRKLDELVERIAKTISLDEPLHATDCGKRANKKSAKKPKGPCIFCNDRQHVSGNCNVFSTPDMRRVAASNKSICTRCLMTIDDGEIHKSCPRKGTVCPQCRQNHDILFCENQKIPVATVKKSVISTARIVFNLPTNRNDEELSQQTSIECTQESQKAGSSPQDAIPMSDISIENPLSEIVMSFPQAMEEEQSVRSSSRERRRSVMVVPSNTTSVSEVVESSVEEERLAGSAPLATEATSSSLRNDPERPNLPEKIPRKAPPKLTALQTLQQSPNTKKSWTADESLTVVPLAQGSSDIQSSSKLVRAKNLPQAGEKAGSGPALIDIDYPAEMPPSPIPVSSPQKRTDEQSDRSVERGRHRRTVTGTNTTTGLTSMDDFVEEEGPTGSVSVTSGATSGSIQNNTGYRGPRTRSRVAVEARIPPANRHPIATPQNEEATSSKEIKADTQSKRKRVTDEEKRKRELEKQQKKEERARAKALSQLAKNQRKRTGVTRNKKTKNMEKPEFVESDEDFIPSMDLVPGKRSINREDFDSDTSEEPVKSSTFIRYGTSDRKTVPPAPRKKSAKEREEDLESDESPEKSEVVRRTKQGQVARNQRIASWIDVQKTTVPSTPSRPPAETPTNSLLQSARPLDSESIGKESTDVEANEAFDWSSDASAEENGNLIRNSQSFVASHRFPCILSTPEMGCSLGALLEFVDDSCFQVSLECPNFWGDPFQAQFPMKREIGKFFTGKRLQRSLRPPYLLQFWSKSMIRGGKLIILEFGDHLPERYQKVIAMFNKKFTKMILDRSEPQISEYSQIHCDDPRKRRTDFVEKEQEPKRKKQ